MNATNSTTARPFNLATLAPAIARHLSGYLSASAGYAAPWTASDVQHYPRAEGGECTLTRADGLALYLVAGGYGKAGRITVTHSRPRDARGQWVELWADKGGGRLPSPEITVSQTKSAEAIAADIARRLLPDAESVEAKARARIAEGNAYHAGRVALLRAVCDAAGMKAPEVGQDDRDTSFAVDLYASQDERKAYRPSARAQVRGGYVEITAEARTEGQARALVAFLRSPAYLSA